MTTATIDHTRANKTDAGNGSKAICRVFKVHPRRRLIRDVRPTAMHHLYFPACPVEGPIEPPVPFGHMGTRARFRTSAAVAVTCSRADALGFPLICRDTCTSTMDLAVFTAQRTQFCMRIALFARRWRFHASALDVASFSTIAFMDLPAARTLRSGAAALAAWIGGHGNQTEFTSTIRTEGQLKSFDGTRTQQ